MSKRSVTLSGLATKKEAATAYVGAAIVLHRRGELTDAKLEKVRAEAERLSAEADQEVDRLFPRTRS